MTDLDTLESCKTQLSLMQNIASMRSYAAAWLILARAYRAIGFRANAEYCRSCGVHYSRIARIAGGEYVRLIDMSVAKLIEVG